MRLIGVQYILHGAVFGSYFALWQNDLMARGFGLSQIATLVAVQTLIQLVMEVPTGVLSDWIGHKTTTLIGFAVYLCALLIPAFVHSPEALAAGVLMMGLGGAFVSGARDAWAAEIQERTHQDLKVGRFARRDQLERLGMIAGALSIPGLAALAYGRFGTPWSLVALVVVALITIAVLAPGVERRTRTFSTVAGPVAGIANVLKTGTLPRVLFAVFIFGLADGVVSVAFWPKVQSLGVKSAVLFGAIQTSLSCARILGLQFYRSTRLIEHPRAVEMSILGSALFFLAFSFTHQPFIAIATWLVRVAAISAYFSAIQARLIREAHDPRTRATVLSSATFVGALGTVTSSSTIGILGASDLGLVLAAGAACTAISGLIFIGRTSRVGDVRASLADVRLAGD